MISSSSTHYLIFFLVELNLCDYYFTGNQRVRHVCTETDVLMNILKKSSFRGTIFFFRSKYIPIGNRLEDRITVRRCGHLWLSILKPLDGDTLADTYTLKSWYKALEVCIRNVKALFEAGKLEILLMQFDKLKMAILSFSETHWAGSGIIRREKSNDYPHRWRRT